MKKRGTWATNQTKNQGSFVWFVCLHVYTYITSSAIDTAAVKIVVAIPHDDDLSLSSSSRAHTPPGTYYYTNYVLYVICVFNRSRALSFSLFCVRCCRTLKIHNFSNHPRPRISVLGGGNLGVGARVSGWLGVLPLQIKWIYNDRCIRVQTSENVENIREMNENAQMGKTKSNFASGSKQIIFSRLIKNKLIVCK